MKSLAPFGKYLHNSILSGKSIGAAIIFMGNKAYKAARSLYPELPYTMYIPPLTSPFDYDWPVEGCKVYLCDCGYSKDSFIRFCALCFLSYDAKVVRYIGNGRILNFEKGISL